MTKKEFAQMTSKLTLLDGATGSNLLAAGMPRGACPEEWIIEHKDIIIELQKAYIQAGSQIIYSPTFGGNRVNLTKHKLEGRLSEINKTLVSYSQEAALGKVLVAGDITTTGQLMEPLGDMTYEAAFDAYKEQIQCLSDAGADLLVAETMISIEETCAALDAAQAVCDLPVMCSITVQADGSIFTGGNIVEAVKTLTAAGASAVGINCSVGPDQLVSIVKNIAASTDLPVIAKPNAGMPTINAQGMAEYHMSPEDFARHVRTLADNGATMVGGCCGTTPAHIAQLAQALGL